MVVRHRGCACVGNAEEAGGLTDVLVDQRLLIGSTGHAEDSHEYRAEAKARTARDYIKDNHAARSVSVMNEETWISDVVTVPRRHDPKSEQPPGTL